MCTACYLQCTHAPRGMITLFAILRQISQNAFLQDDIRVK